MKFFKKLHKKLDVKSFNIVLPLVDFMSMKNKWLFNILFDEEFKYFLKKFLGLNVIKFSLGVNFLLVINTKGKIVPLSNIFLYACQ